MAGREEALEEMAHGATDMDEGTGPGLAVRGEGLPEGGKSDREKGKPCGGVSAPEDRGKYHRWRRPDGLTLLRAWTRSGLSEREIAAKCGVARSTLARWKQQYPEIAEALDYGPEQANAEVESALHSLAVGYTKALRKTYKVKHVEYGENGRKLREYEELETGIDDVHVPPNMSAQKFWLENRAPEAWGDEAGKGGPGEGGQPVRILCDIPRGGIPPGEPEAGRRAEGAARTNPGEGGALEVLEAAETGLTGPSLPEAGV